MNAAEAQATLAAIAAETPEKAVLIALDESGDRMGVVHLETSVDFFTRERHGHISVVAVAPGGERRGIGRALLQAAEDWTRARGYRFLTLNVFEGNERARHVYESAGFGIDTIKYLKLV